MPKITIIDNEYATLWYYPDKKIIHHQFHQFVFGETLYQFLLTGTEILRDNHAEKWLSDDRDITGLARTDIEWGQRVWMPMTVAAGWKFWAIVRPTNAEGQVDLEYLAREYGRVGVMAQFFDTPEDALAWLENL